MLLNCAVSYFFIPIVWLNHHHPISVASLKRRRKNWCGAISSSPPSVVRFAFHGTGIRFRVRYRACQGICIDFRFRGRTIYASQHEVFQADAAIVALPIKRSELRAIITLAVLRIATLVAPEKFCFPSA